MLRRRLLPARTSPASPALRWPALGLVAVFVLGGLVAPDLHRASHAAEWAAERAAHAAAHHHGLSDRADTPCPPAVDDLDCALCAGVSFATPGTPATVRPPDRRAASPPTAWISAASADAATARPRGPPAA